MYDLGMTTKVRKTLTLDPDVVESYGDDATTLSATVNAVLRAELDRRERRAALQHFVEALDAEFGPADRGEVERFRNALS